MNLSASVVAAIFGVQNFFASLIAFFDQAPVLM